MKEIKGEDIRVLVADAEHEKYVDTIIETIREAARKRGTGIAERTHEYVATKMKEGKAVLALDGDRFVGFSYIETWGNKHYVTTSGLIVHPDYQGLGVAKRIKDYTFTLARLRWPNAKIFSLTSGDAGCINHDILEAKNRKFCVCTGMLWDPDKHKGEPTSLEVIKDVMRTLVLRGIE